MIFFAYVRKGISLSCHVVHARRTTRTVYYTSTEDVVVHDMDNITVCGGRLYVCMHDRGAVYRGIRGLFGEGEMHWFASKVSVDGDFIVVFPFHGNLTGRSRDYRPEFVPRPFPREG